MSAEARIARGPIEELRPANLTPARTLGERLAAAGAFVALVAVDLVMRVAGFRRFHALVGRWPRSRRRQADAAAIGRVCVAVDRAASYYFKRAWCLQRSATTTCLLRLAGAPAQMVIGVAKVPFYAHAWVEVEGRVVNDHPMVQQRYTVLERC